MFLSSPCLGGLQVHFIKNTRRTKARRRLRLERVQRVEDFLRPYKLKGWNATRWEMEKLEKMRQSRLLLGTETGNTIGPTGELLQTETEIGHRESTRE